MSKGTDIKCIDDALKLCRESFWAVGLYSFCINILMLTPIFYMINVFDKAVATGSIPTLFSLIVIASFLYLYWVCSSGSAPESWWLSGRDWINCSLTGCTLSVLSHKLVKLELPT